MRLESKSLQTIVEKISIISELGLKITSTLNEDSIVGIIYSSIKNFMDLSYFCIGIYDQYNFMVNYMDVISNGQKEKKSSISIDDNLSFAANFIKNRQIIIVNDITKEFPKYIDKKAYKAQLELSINAQLNSRMF